MSKLFNAQNLSSNKWKTKEYLIYFTNNDGSYRIYRYNRTTGAYQLASSSKELLKAEHIYISYSYLGGINLSNYNMQKAENGNQVILTFTLGRLTSLSGVSGQFWDIPRAAFMLKDAGGSLHVRGLEPIKTITITLTSGIITNTQLVTFQDEIIGSDDRVAKTCDYGTRIVNGEQKTLLTLFDHNIGDIISSNYNALNSVFSNGAATSPHYLSFRAGAYDEELSFSDNFDLIAAFYSFVKKSSNNQWYRRLYFVSQADNAFHIDLTPSTQAMVSVLENQLGTTQLNEVGDWMDLQTFDYYSLDNDLYY